MPKKNIIIAGGGFAGVSALRRLNKYRRFLDKDFRIVLIDKKPYSEFLPMLPDIIGGWMAPENLRYSLALEAKKMSADFIRGEILDLDPGKKKIKVNESEIDYEYVILSAGSQTNFYGNALGAKCLKLDDVEDAVRIRDTLLKKAVDAGGINVVIIGGGYTGIEIAANVDFLVKGKAKRYKIHIVEKAEDVLLMVSGYVRSSVKGELKKLGIEVICKDTLKGYDKGEAVLDSGLVVPDAVCIWCPGVKASDFLRTRISVDEELRPTNPEYKDKGIFAAGDAASFDSVRMAVMFAMGQGKAAACNIVSSIQKKPLAKYHPVDLGYVVPMAIGAAPGIVLAKKIGGRVGYFLHYFMCVYRSRGGNRMGILKALCGKNSFRETRGGRNG